MVYFRYSTRGGGGKGGETSVRVMLPYGNLLTEDVFHFPVMAWCSLPPALNNTRPCLGVNRASLYVHGFSQVNLSLPMLFFLFFDGSFLSVAGT